MKQKENKVNPYWVKKKVSVIDWEYYYSKNESYCYLKKEGRQIHIAFLVINKISEDEELLSEEELRKVDLSRRSKWVMPYPLKLIEKN